MALFTLKGSRFFSQSFIIALLIPMLLALPQLLVSNHSPLAFGTDTPLPHPLLVFQVADDTAHPHPHGEIEPGHHGHWHGHHPADHSHGAAYPAVLPQHNFPSAGCGVSDYESVCTAGHSRPLERPPKAALNG